MSRKVRDLSRETLNLPHMMGLPNRTLEPISRSWSFCANDIEAESRTGFALRRQSLRDRADANPRKGLAEATILRDCAGGHWQ